VFRVPLPTLQWIGQHAVRLLDLQEALAIAALLVGMEALGQLAVGSLDFGVAGLTPDAQRSIGIYWLCHGRP
jgi:hypothetical protein